MIWILLLVNLYIVHYFQIADRLFRMEENGVANEIVENLVLFLQYVAHPLFILSHVSKKNIVFILSVSFTIFWI